MMVHPEVVIHPCIGLVDWSPSSASQLNSGKVEGDVCKFNLSFNPQFLTPMNNVDSLEVV